MDSTSEIKGVPVLQDCPYCKKRLPPACPKCGSLKVACNGRIGDRQNYRCTKDVCRKRFVFNPSKPRITDKDWRIVDSLLGDDIEVPVIHRATGISKRHIYNRKKSRGEN